MWGEKGFGLVSALLASAIATVLFLAIAQMILSASYQTSLISQKADGQNFIHQMKQIMMSELACTQSLRGHRLWANSLQQAESFQMRLSDGSVFASQGQRVNGGYRVSHLQISNPRPSGMNQFTATASMGLEKLSGGATIISADVNLFVSAIPTGNAGEFLIESCGAREYRESQNVRLNVGLGQNPQTGGRNTLIYVTSPGDSQLSIRLKDGTVWTHPVANPGWANANDGLHLDIAAYLDSIGESDGSATLLKDNSFYYIYAVPESPSDWRLRLIPSESPPWRATESFGNNQYRYLGPVYFVNRTIGVLPFVQSTQKKFEYVATLPYLIEDRVQPAGPTSGDPANTDYIRPRLIPPSANRGFFNMVMRTNDDCSTCDGYVQTIFRFLPDELTNVQVVKDQNSADIRPAVLTKNPTEEMIVKRIYYSVNGQVGPRSTGSPGTPLGQANQEYRAGITDALLITLGFEDEYL